MNEISENHDSKRFDGLQHVDVLRQEICLHDTHDFVLHKARDLGHIDHLLDNLWNRDIR